MQLHEMNLWQVMIFRLYILYNKHKMIKIGTQNREISQVLSQVLEYFFGGVYIYSCSCTRNRFTLLRKESTKHHQINTSYSHIDTPKIRLKVTSGIELTTLDSVQWASLKDGHALILSATGALTMRLILALNQLSRGYCWLTHRKVQQWCLRQIQPL